MTPLDNREMRLALGQPDSGIEAICQGILKGDNHVDNVTAIIWLHRNFHDLNYLRRVIELWPVGDKYIMELIDAAGKIRASTGTGQASVEQVQQWKTEIHAINEKAMPAAKTFSDVFGEGSQALLRPLLVANLATVNMFIFPTFLRTRQQLMQRQEVENASDVERERTQTTLISIGDGVITADTQGGISYFNPAVEQMTNRTLDKARGLPPASLFRIADESSQEEGVLPIEQILSGKIDGGREHPKLVLRHDGSSAPVILIGTLIYRGGETTGAALVPHDMTREHQCMTRLSWQATHDALTGLTNRRELEYRLRTALECLGRNSGRHALMFLNLGQFKSVNDIYGHAAGDELPYQVCALLQQDLCEGDTSARPGGDEFGTPLEGCPAGKAVEIADYLRKTAQDLHLIWSGQPFNCIVSVDLVHLLPGISILEEALHSADMAYHMVKERGRDRVQVSRQDDIELSICFGKMTWVQRTHLALEEDRSNLYAQSTIPLDEGAEESLYVKLLLRLYDEGGRLVPSSSFISATEHYGLMTSVDRWVVKNAFRTLVERVQGPHVGPTGTCAINPSGATIGGELFLQFLTELFTRYHIPPQAACFGVAETTAAANLVNATRFINELKDIDCRFSLDDFCAGMSPFIYPEYLPMDYLKIDGNFARDMLENPIDRAIIQVINHIGHVMGKHTITEFIEIVEVMEALCEIGIDYVQGLVIGVPLPLSRQPPGAGLDVQSLWPSLGWNLRQVTVERRKNSFAAMRPLPKRRRGRRV